MVDGQNCTSRAVNLLSRNGGQHWTRKNLADAGCGCAVRDDGWYGPVEDSLFDELFEGGDVDDVVDAFLLFDLAGWRGCVVYNRVII